MIQGNNLIISTVSGNTTTPIAAAKSCNVSLNADTKEISSPTSGVYRHFIAGRKSWKVSVNYLVASNSTFISKLKKVGDSFSISMGIRDNINDSATGTAILTESKITGTRGNLITGSWVFTGSGALTFSS